MCGTGPRAEERVEPSDSYCGIYCGACSILNHGETGRGDGFIACCSSVPQEELACGAR